MAYNPYTEAQPVFIEDPSKRLQASGISRFNFPYTPTISSIINTNYNIAATTHSNYQQAFFESAANASFSVAAPIIIENEEQGKHIIKALDFFRGSMKMKFGLGDDERGLPPPVLRFTGHGVYVNVPVIITDFTYNLDSDMSYIEIDRGTFDSGSVNNTGETVVRLPVSSTFVMTLQTTYSPKNVRDNFTLDAYLSGQLKGRGYV